MGKKNIITRAKAHLNADHDINMMENKLEESKVRSFDSTQDSEDEPQGRNPQSISP